MERGAIVLQDFGERVEASKLIQSSKMKALSFTTLARNLLDLGVTYKRNSMAH